MLTKIFLAYIAYEAVVKAARSLRLREVSDLALSANLNPVLAVTLQENFEINEILGTQQDFGTEFKNKINLFIDGTTDYIVCVAYGLRNKFADRDSTASAVITSKEKH